MNWSNQITDLLKIQYPILQAPMLGASSIPMLLAAQKANCLGSLALGDWDGEICLEKVKEVKTLTDRPFSVNIFANAIPEITDELREKYDRTKKRLEAIAFQLNWDVLFPEIDAIKPQGYRKQIEKIIEGNIKILSFTFGSLDRETIQLLKSYDVILIGTCTSLKEALILENLDIDILCVQGLEAGGHRGSFQENKIPKIGGFALLNEVSNQVKTPLIYGGGIRNGKTLLAAKNLGAQGFVVGTALLCSEESNFKPFEKQKISNLSEDEIMLTKSFSGRYAQGIRNKFINELENSNLILPYPYQNKLTQPLRDYAKKMENTDCVGIWVGQAFRNLKTTSTTEILRQLISDAETLNA